MELNILRRMCTRYFQVVKSHGHFSIQVNLQQRRNPLLGIPVRCLSTSNVCHEQTGRTGKTNRRFQLPRQVEIFLFVFSVVGFGYSYYYIQKKIREKQLELVKQSAVEEQPVLIGGDWELVNQDGKLVSNKDFVGKWCIVYFGFTHCPDICPDEIEKIIEVTDILERTPGMPKMIPMFVTVDPDRDSPEIVKQYLEEFSPKMVGLTGTWDQLKVILREFKVYFSKGPVDEDGDYIVDHSIITFLMDPEGRYAAHFPRSKTNIDIATAIEKKVKLYKPPSSRH
ncbi:protein SCO1 homolog, mitochondrial-like isoform X2 [Mya arenaria]|uniref:protein SCO1 homolog, mitochondrial-like isoform X2 n=1 Tax=Mya arenaria TaxID=6604 RepID=UPI0022E4E554|nr:protein SCO1 homolog, mitochondrial-like isoform X2 [Mya arenaria]